MNWFVLYVKSNYEKKVAKELAGKDIEVFCPMKTEKRQWSDRVKTVEVPYFRSYVFAKFAEKNTNYILETRGVVGRLYWLRKPAMIRDNEMQEVKEFFTTHTAIEPINFTEGEEVKITHGALKDKKGIVLLNDKHQVTLNIPALGCGFKVIVNKNKLQK